MDEEDAKWKRKVIENSSSLFGWTYVELLLRERYGGYGFESEDEEKSKKQSRGIEEGKKMWQRMHFNEQSIWVLMEQEY